MKLQVEIKEYILWLGALYNANIAFQNTFRKVASVKANDMNPIVIEITEMGARVEWDIMSPISFWTITSLWHERNCT